MKKLSDFYIKHKSLLLKQHNYFLRKIKYDFLIKDIHVCQRLKERNINMIDFFKVLNNLLKNHLCLMIYYTKLNKPFYNFEIRTQSIIIVIGFNSSNVNSFVVRTVLDPKIHNKHYTSKNTVVINL